MRSLITKGQIQRADIKEELEAALARLDQAHTHHLAGDPLERRLLNHAVFKRINIGSDGEIANGL